MNFLNVFSSIEKTGGASYDMMAGTLNPNDGYMVALIGYEKLYTVPKNLNEFQSIVVDYLTKDTLGILLTRENTYLGFWIDGTTLYVDISDKIEHKEVAITAGVVRSQKAIWDNAKKEAIVTKHERKLVSDDPDILTDKKY